MRILIIFAAQYLYLVIILIAVLSAIFTAYQPKKGIIKFTAITLPIAFIIGKILNQFITSPRPFVAENIQPLFPHGTDNGFPSDHTLIAMTVAAIVFTYNRKLGITLGLLAILVGAARVVAKVHYPIDIIGSIIIAISIVAFVSVLLNTVNFVKAWLK